MNGITCWECEGLGTTVQGWTDKNGYSEDQYGTCPVCYGHGTTDDNGNATKGSAA